MNTKDLARVAFQNAQATYRANPTEANAAVYQQATKAAVDAGAITFREMEDFARDIAEYGQRK